MVAPSVKELAQDFLSLRGGVFIFGKLCLILAVAAAYNVGVTLSNLQRNQLSVVDLDAGGAIEDEDLSRTLQTYDVIASRNIFGVTEKKTETPTPTAAPTSKLKLRLVGTHINPGSEPFAIIEETKKNEQEIFDLNQKVFGQAKLVEVLPEQVKLSYRGRIETLVLEEGSKSSKRSSSSSSSSEDDDDQTLFTVPEEELTEALSNLPRLLSQARAVPYFKNGESIGMRLFAIRRGSMYEKLGLKNGDIIKSVNQNSLSDPSQALKIFEQLKNEKAIKVLLERRGEERNLSYEIQ